MSDVNSLITSLSQKYSINTSKPHFPVNSMRLYYLLLTHALTDGNEEAIEKTNRCVPLISAILDARDSVLASSGGKTTPVDEFNGCKEALDALFKEIDTPELRQAMQMLFLDIYPLQQALLASIDQYLKKEDLSEADLLATLKIRAMDSSLYASVIDEIVHEHISPVGQAKMMPDPLYIQINVTLRINDMVDAIVYAKQDLEANSATIIEIVKRVITNESIHLSQLIDRVFLKLHNESVYSPPSGKNATAYLAAYNHKLMEVVGATPPEMKDHVETPAKSQPQDTSNKSQDTNNIQEPKVQHVDPLAESPAFVEDSGEAMQNPNPQSEPVTDNSTIEDSLSDSQIQEEIVESSNTPTPSPVFEDLLKQEQDANNIQATPPSPVIPDPDPGSQNSQSPQIQTSNSQIPNQAPNDPITQIPNPASHPELVSGSTLPIQPTHSPIHASTNEPHPPSPVTPTSTVIPDPDPGSQNSQTPQVQNPNSQMEN